MDEHAEHRAPSSGGRFKIRKAVHVLRHAGNRPRRSTRVHSHNVHYRLVLSRDTELTRAPTAIQDQDDVMLPDAGPLHGPCRFLRHLNDRPCPSNTYPDLYSVWYTVWYTVWYYTHVVQVLHAGKSCNG